MYGGVGRDRTCVEYKYVPSSQYPHPVRRCATYIGNIGPYESGLPADFVAETRPYPALPAIPVPRRGRRRRIIPRLIPRGFVPPPLPALPVAPQRKKKKKKLKLQYPPPPVQQYEEITLPSGYVYRHPPGEPLEVSLHNIQLLSRPGAVGSRNPTYGRSAKEVRRAVPMLQLSPRELEVGYRTPEYLSPR
jgi:hypothetical protein